MRVNLKPLAAVLRYLVKWLALGSTVGVLAGIASAIFLVSLAWATQFRLDHPQILYGLPLAGFALSWVYQRYGGTAVQGSALIIEGVHTADVRVPRRMAPMILAGTVLTHLFGGSAGREGTALQMGGSLADALRQWLNLNDADRRLLLLAGISGGFGSVFGTPLAGALFGVEVPTVGRLRLGGVPACLTAALVGDVVTRGLGVAHAHYPALRATPMDALLLAKVGLAGVACGLTSIVFIELTHAIRHLMLRVQYVPLRPLIGGFALIGMTVLLGSRDYLGLGLPLITAALSGLGVTVFAFALKLVFTAVTLGSGFLGGEVTPLFVIGATLGYSLGSVLGVDPAWLAALGFVAVFAGASNTPLACAVMGWELFGSGAIAYLFVICAVAFFVSGRRSIYSSQRFGDC